MNGREHTHTRAHTHILYSGMISLAPEQNEKKKKYLDFRRDWYAQASSATISSDGERTDCSDAVDDTGRYIWRENGEKDGRCYGIDFRKAGQIWNRSQNDQCGNDPICQSAAITTYVPFAYDAGIALAHGLHKLISLDGIRPDKITAKALSDAIRKSTFEGVSGNVSFLENGDREVTDLPYAVYNYHAMNATGKFELVGRMQAGMFEKECGHGNCAPMIFSNGKERIPVSQVRETKLLCVAIFHNIFLPLAPHSPLSLSLGLISCLSSCLSLSPFHASYSHPTCAVTGDLLTPFISVWDHMMLY